MTETDGARTLDEAPRSALLAGVERAITVQRPVVLAHVRRLRRRYPGATPEQLVRVLERHYLTAVTSGGAAVGATAAVPGVGTGISLALSGAETVGFLEATGLFALSVAEVHGVAVQDPVRARAIVMTLMLGRAGDELVRQFTGQAGGGPTRSEHWAKSLATSMPQAMTGPVAERIRSAFVRRFLANASGSMIGRLAPFGIGAVIGGVGSNALGRYVVKAARSGFGPAPLVVPAEIEPPEGATGRRRLRLGRGHGEGEPRTRKARRRSADEDDGTPPATD